MDRTSKLFILAWAVVALLIECYYLSGGWPTTARLAPLLLVAAAAGAWRDRRIVAPVLAVAYFFPVVIQLTTGRYHVLTSVVWLAPLLGVTIPDAIRDGWRVPARWRVALVCWVGGVCATAPIVAFRAVDFRWELLFRGRLPYEALGGVPLLTVSWVLHVALLLAVGLLWFDWLCGVDEPFFLRWIATPLAGSVLVLGAVACYQLFVDVDFLNYSVYAMFSRASATMFDANVAGALAALWIGGWAALALDSPSRVRIGGGIVAALLWLPVWASGSRTAFGAAACVTLACIPPLLPERYRSGRYLFTAAATAVVVGGLATWAISRYSIAASGPVGRIAAMLPEPSVSGLRAFTAELWNRNRYGEAATVAIDRYPLFGIGVGAFHEMAGELIQANLAPDNAQNWYRHQLVELGVVGSVGWIVFVAAFGWWVLRTHSRERPASWPIRGALLGIGLVSWVGMPGQDPLVAVTVWTFAAWHLLVGGRPQDNGAPRGLPWMVAAAVIIVFVTGTAQLAAGRLRVPERLARTDRDYSYGFWWPEPDGRGGEFRWARRDATIVIATSTRLLELTLRVNPDMVERPLRVKAWVDGRVVIEGELTAAKNAMSARVLIPDGQRRIVLDTWAERSVVLPPPDGREAAVMVGWRAASQSP